MTSSKSITRPDEGRFTLCKMSDFPRNRTSECQDPAILTFRRNFLGSLPMSEGDKPAQFSPREVSLVISKLVRDAAEPESSWASNLNTLLRQSMFSRLPGTIRNTGINVAQSELWGALETLLKYATCCE